jgi:hypothetical protein
MGGASPLGRKTGDVRHDETGSVSPGPFYGLTPGAVDDQSLP